MNKLTVEKVKKGQAVAMQATAGMVSPDFGGYQGSGYFYTTRSKGGEVVLNMHDQNRNWTECPVSVVGSRAAFVAPRDLVVVSDINGEVLTVDDQCVDSAHSQYSYCEKCGALVSAQYGEAPWEDCLPGCTC